MGLCRKFCCFCKFASGGVDCFPVDRQAIRGLLRGFGVSMFIKKGVRMIDAPNSVHEKSESADVIRIARC